MQNENIVQNNPIPTSTDWLLDSPSYIQIEQFNTVSGNNLSEHSENTETSSVDEGETEKIVYQNVEVIDYTETLTEINGTLHHIDQTVELGVCLFIIIVIIVLMHYVYKFFKMFF